MDILSGEISSMIFRRTVRNDLGEFSLDSQMLTVLMELDGKEKVSGIMKKTGFDMVTMKEVIDKLLNLSLIEVAEDSIAILDMEFFDYLNTELSLAVGPIAGFLIEDAISDLGHRPSRFPTHRAAELVDLLGREIQREEKRVVFKQNMIVKIKENGS